MIITLKNADFSKSNIGTLSTWRISRSLGAGATYEGVTSVDKDAALNATVTIADGYEIGAAGVTVTMGGVGQTYTQVGNVITITIAKVTGNVVIKVPTVNTSTGEEDYTLTINPTPADATVTLTASGYTQNGNSITVPNGTTVSWGVSADGYTTKTGTYTMTASNYTLPVTLIAEGESGTTTLTPNGNAKSYVVKKDGSTMSGGDYGNLEYDLTAGQGGTINITTTHTIPGVNQYADVVMWALFSGAVSTDTILTPVGPDIHDGIYTATIDMSQYPTATKLRVFGSPRSTMKDTTVVTHTA